MRRSPLPLVLFALVLAPAACGDGTAGPSSTVAAGDIPATIAAPTTTTAAPTTTTTAARLEAAALAYRYEPDTSLMYRLDLEQRIGMRAEGDQGAFGDEELPLDADLRVSASTLMTYEVYPGPDEGTSEITITAEFADVAVAGSVNGEPFDPTEDDLDVREIAPIEVTVVVDEQGNVLSVSGADDAAGLLGPGLSGLQSLGAGDLGRPLGPAFPEGELAVGDSWAEERSEEGPDGPIVTRTTHTVVASETLDGVPVLVIESVSETDAFELDMSEFFRALFEGFAGMAEGITGTTSASETTVPPDLEEMLEQLVFTISLSPGRATAMTWFDPATGVVRKAEQKSVVSMTMTFRGPDDDTGELVGFTMEMDVDQTATYALEEGAGA
jgi:hypothetical protein